MGYRKLTDKQRGQMSKLIPSEIVKDILFTRWISVFGMPRIIFCDMDPTFNLGHLDWCEIIYSPPKHHSSIGIIERRHRVFKATLERVFDEYGDSEMTIQQIIGYASLVENASISQIDGNCAGHRVFGRSPRLPIGDNETADFPLIMNTALAPERYSQMTTKCLADIHKYIMRRCLAIN